jgi:Mn2+/Fe2+ NRAMP family transporter
LINDEGLMGHLKNSHFYNILAWGTLITISIAVITMLGGQLLQALGIKLFG